MKTAKKKKRALIRVMLSTAQRQIVFEALALGNKQREGAAGKNHAWYAFKVYDLLGFGEVEEAVAAAHEDFMAAGAKWNEGAPGERGARPKLHKLTDDAREFKVPYAVAKYIQQSFDACTWDGIWDWAVIVTTAEAFGVDYSAIEDAYDMDGDAELEDLESFEEVEEEEPNGDIAGGNRDEVESAGVVGDSARSEPAA